MNTFSIAYIISGLVVGVIFGCITRYMNESKGYEGGFAWGFWLTFIGVIVVACKPENRSYVSNGPTQLTEEARRQQILSSGGWKCSCGNVNYDYCTSCSKCGVKKWDANRNQRSAQQTEQKKCPHCGAINDATSDYCRTCHESLRGATIISKGMGAQSPNTATNDSQSNSASSQIEMIKKLAELHDSGILTDEEFSTKKAELLSKL